MIAPTGHIAIHPAQPTHFSSDIIANSSICIALTSHFVKHNPHDVHFDELTDGIGPFDIGLLLTKQAQRIAIIGDGDFLSNAYLGNAGNLDLGVALINWLVGDDELISIPVTTGNDIQLNLSKIHSIIIGLGFFLALPILLLSIGTLIWWRRRHR